MPTRILLVDEQQLLRQELRALLEKEPDFTVVAEADTGDAAVQLAAEARPEVVVLSLAGARPQELDPVHRLVAAVPAPRVIGLSIHTDRRFVLEVLKAGAHGYVLKEHAFEELAPAIRAVQAQKTYLSQGLPNIIGQDYTRLLREREAHFRAIFEGSSLGIALVDDQGRVVESNPALQALLGLSQEELRQKGLAEFAPPGEISGFEKLFQDLRAGKREPRLLETEYRRQDGSLSWGRLSLSPLPGGGMEGRAAIVTLEDISYQKRAEAQIRDYQEKLRAIAQELSLTEEEERRRLATGLHDRVGQVLALVQIKLGGLRASASDPLAAPLDEVRSLIEQTIRYTRSLGFELSSPLLYDLGFESAMEWLADQLRDQHGVPITLAADPAPKPLTEEVRVLLFHLMRDLLTNIIKRAQPDQVTILISRSEAQMKLIIEGGGEIGLDTEPPDAFGLFGIKERLRNLGGRLELGPAPGIKLSLLVPLAAPRPGEVALPLAPQPEQPAEIATPGEGLQIETSQPGPAEAMLRESEERYYRLLELSPEAIVIHSEGKIVYVSPAGIRLFGAETPTQIIGKSMVELVHPDYRENLRDRISLVERGLEAIALQRKKLLRLDGEELEVELGGISVTYLGKPAGQMLIRDISEQIKAEEARRESEQRLATFIDFLPDATLVIDKEGKIIAWNRAIEEMTGIKAEDMLGKGNYEYALPFYGERRPLLLDLVLKPQEEAADYPELTRGSLSLAAETYVPRFRGREAYLCEKAGILRDSQGNATGALESIRALAAGLGAETERPASSQPEFPGPLAGAIARELDHILAAVLEDIGPATASDQTDPPPRERLARAEEACRQAQAWSRQLLTFAQGGAPVGEPVSLADLLKESAHLTLSGSKSRGELAIQDDLWKVAGDARQLQQALGGLLRNAVQAMPKGGIVQIRGENIRAEREPDLPISEGKYAKLSIADEGGGIPSKYLDKIFDPDFSHPRLGGGLGLALAYAIIKNHSGYIKVESRAGVGTTFHVYLPALDAAASAADHEPGKSD